MTLTMDGQAVESYRELRGRLAEAETAEKVDALAEMARTVRRLDLEMIARARLGHIGGDYSVTDILVTLYGAILSVDPQDPQAPERDRFILSKGHTAGA